MILLIGIVMGLALGLTGAGGSILAVPLLVWCLGWTLQQAAPLALLALCASSILGTIAAWDVRIIRYRLAMLMAAVGMIFAPLGIHMADTLPQSLLSALLAALLFASAARLWRQAHAPNAETGGDPRVWQNFCRLHPDTGRIVWNHSAKLTAAGIGSLAGFLSGLLGASGGVVMVPGLRSFSHLSMHSAVATTLMAIAIISSCTVGWHFVIGFDLAWPVVATFVGGAAAGMLAGRRMAAAIDGVRLQQMFALLLTLTGSGMAVRAWRLF